MNELTAEWKLDYYQYYDPYEVVYVLFCSNCGNETYDFNNSDYFNGKYSEFLSRHGVCDKCHAKMRVGESELDLL